MKRIILLGVLMSVITLGGCAGSDAFQLRLHDVMHSTLEQAGENLSVAVSDFKDQRPQSEHLGSHICIIGHITPFELMESNLGKGVSDAFVDYLQKSGFKAINDTGGMADVRITGTVTKFSANATGKFLRTNLEVEMVMEFVIANVADGSTIRMTIGAGGTDDVTFFGSEDMEALVNAVLQEGFEELIEQTVVQGKTLRRKI